MTPRERQVFREFVDRFLKDKAEKQHPGAYLNFVSRLSDILISKLRTPTPEEDMRTRIRDDSRDEESHAEHYIFRSFLEGREPQPGEIRPESYVTLKFGSAILGFLFRSGLLETKRQPPSPTEAQDRLLWALEEISAMLETLPSSSEKERVFLQLAFVQDPKGPYALFSDAVLTLFYEQSLSIYESAEKALEALQPHPEAVLNKVLGAIRQLSYYSQQERERILAAKAGKERAEAMFDFVPFGSPIDRAQINLLQRQFGMKTDEIIELLRSRRDFKEEEEVFVRVAQEGTRSEARQSPSEDLSQLEVIQIAQKTAEVLTPGFRDAPLSPKEVSEVVQIIKNGKGSLFEEALLRAVANKKPQGQKKSAPAIEISEKDEKWTVKNFALESMAQQQAMAAA